MYNPWQLSSRTNDEPFSQEPCELPRVNYRSLRYVHKPCKQTQWLSAKAFLFTPLLVMRKRKATFRWTCMVFNGRMEEMVSCC